MGSARLKRLAIEVLNERTEDKQKRTEDDAWYAAAAARHQAALNN
jgi:hypothetical protein